MKLYFINCHFPPCLEVSGALEKCFLNKKACSIQNLNAEENSLSMQSICN